MKNLIDKMISVKCLKCGEVLISKHAHDYRICNCRVVRVTGGPYTPEIYGPRDLMEIIYIDPNKENRKDD